MLTEDERRYFEDELAHHESKYLATDDRLKQSGFGRDDAAWERYRRVVTAPIDKDGTFLDIGCANGVLMESVVLWGAQSGYAVEPYGVDVSEKLVALARRRLPHWSDRLYVGNALWWSPPFRFDFVRTELVYVPPTLRRQYVERLLDEFVAPGGCVIACSYGSSRPEGVRAEPLIDEFAQWGVPIGRVYDVVGDAPPAYLLTRVVSLPKR